MYLRYRLIFTVFLKMWYKHFCLKYLGQVRWPKESNNIYSRSGSLFLKNLVLGPQGVPLD